eukprot:3507_1
MSTRGHNKNMNKKQSFYDQLFKGQVLGCQIRHLKNNDSNSAFMYGTLEYMTNNKEVRTIEYCTKPTNLKPGDMVTFNFSSDDNVLNRYANNVTKRHVRLICISDTHNSHNKLTDELERIYESDADILIHCGDMTDAGTQRELKAVDKWFGELPYKHIIVTGGNMDGIGLDVASGYCDGDHNRRRPVLRNAVYLEHEAYDLKEFNLRFFGSPYSMRFVGGYQMNSEKQAERLWSQVPEDTDVLICHGPPANILDLTSRGKHTGDPTLYKHVMNRVKPKVMCFGHMHSSFGYENRKGIHFYNCALNNALHPRCNNNYAQTSSYWSSSSWNNSNKKNNDMDVMNAKPHIIDLSDLAQV